MLTYSANLLTSLQFMLSYFANIKWAETPATSRHTRRLLRLLPSGPDRVHKLVLREDQSLHRFCSAQGYPRRQDGLFSIRPPIATLSINY